MKKPYTFKCRGIGKDHIYNCFACGCTIDGLADNISAFVDSKKEGNTIVDRIFNGMAWMDFRESEPKWLQVKFGTCPDCTPALVELQRLTRNGDIYPRDVTLAKLYAKN